MGAFVFDGCHNSPTVQTIDPYLDFQNWIVKIQDSKLEKMLIKENQKDGFSLYNNGLYRKLISTSTNEVPLFGNTPGQFQILPNHHEIEKTKPSTFFYSNERNNFYVHSEGGFNKHLFDDVLVLKEGVLISRKVIVPFSSSNLPLTGTSTMAIENHGAANFSVGNEVVSGLKFTDFSTFPPVFIGKHYAFQTFYHPYVCELIKTLNTSGIDGLYKNVILDTDGGLKDGIQNRVAKNIFIPNGAYNPTAVVHTPYPVEEVDFNYSGM